MKPIGSQSTRFYHCLNILLRHFPDSFTRVTCAWDMHLNNNDNNNFILRLSASIARTGSQNENNDKINLNERHLGLHLECFWSAMFDYLNYLTLGWLSVHNNNNNVLDTLENNVPRIWVYKNTSMRFSESLNLSNLAQYSASFVFVESTSFGHRSNFLADVQELSEENCL